MFKYETKFTTTVSFFFFLRFTTRDPRIRPWNSKTRLWWKAFEKETSLDSVSWRFLRLLPKAVMRSEIRLPAEALSERDWMREGHWNP